MIKLAADNTAAFDALDVAAKADASAAEIKAAKRATKAAADRAKTKEAMQSVSAAAKLAVVFAAPADETPATRIQQIAAAELNALPTSELDSPPAVALEVVVKGAATPKSGHCMSQAQALAEARQAFGKDAAEGVDFFAKKTGRGDWVWGPFDAKAWSEAAKAVKSAKGGKVAKVAIVAKVAAVKGKTAASKRGDGSSNISTMVSLLSSKTGVTIEELASATGWNFDSCRWNISQIARKKLGLNVTKTISDGKTFYKVG